MKRPVPAEICPLSWVLLISLGLWLGCLLPASAQWVNQTVPLQSGWNAVYLRIQPSPAACDQIFSNLPVTKVFHYNARIISTQFGTDPTELWRRPDEWLIWFPKDGTSDYVRQLENLVGGTAYLIQATNDCVLNLMGRPVLPRMEWVPGQANLVGFQVSPYPESRPTIADFFRYEPAIDGDPRLGTNLIAQVGTDLQPINLTSQTTHRKVDPNLAYWIHAQKLSDYTGPLRISTVDPDGLFFGQNFNELILQVSNVRAAGAPPIAITLRHVNSETPPEGASPLAGAIPLLYADRTASNWVWRAWPTDQSQNYDLLAGESMTLRLAVNRAAMSEPSPTNALWQSLLQVSGSHGTFVQVPLSAAYNSGEDQMAAFPYGLWIGEAEINEVTCLRFDTNAEAEVASVPLPAGGSFPLRLILHAGPDGNNRLLSRAVIAAMLDANSNVVNRIYTDEAQVPASATIVARVGSAAFGRIPPVGLSGLGFLNSLQGDYTVDYDDPLNPFKHVYQPDHDNLASDNETLLSEGEESFTVSNRVTLTWNNVPDPVLGASLWNPGETTTGTYEQEIGNLRHQPIIVRGSFILKRVSRVGSAQ